MLNCLLQIIKFTEVVKVKIKEAAVMVRIKVIVEVIVEVIIKAVVIIILIKVIA